MSLALIPQSSQGRPVVVAVIDTGADIAHSYVRSSLWRNPGEIGFDQKGHSKTNNGIDDDGNGFIDDVYGWNFVEDSKNLTDEVGHGTHIAGLIGQNPEVRLMILKAMSSASDNSLSPSVKAIDYAVKMKVDLINYSGGGITPSPDEKEALARAEKAHILVLAAAGNERRNTDRNGFYPADYELTNILSVAAVDLSGELLPSSNFGTHSVHLAAPGLRVLSSLPGEKYGWMTGTSQATAQVTLAASLLCQRQTRCDSPKLIRQMIREADHSAGLEGKIQNPVIVNYLHMAQIQQNRTQFSQRSAHLPQD
jgi:subtilisin family serine protease